MAIGLNANAAAPVAGQDDLGMPTTTGAPTTAGAPVATGAPGASESPVAAVVPTPTLPPGFLPCSTTEPYFTLTDNNPHVGDQVGWWATGLATNTMVIITVRDMLNPNAADAIYKTTTTPNNWCQAMGTLSFSLPIQYQVRLDGVSSGTGQPVSLVIYPFAIPAVVYTPTPLPPSPPAAPTNVRITQLTRSTARVDWDDNSNNETGFVIMTRTGQFDVPANTRTLTIGGLETNQIHCFRVFAINAVGRSLSDVDCLHIRPTNP